MWKYSDNNNISLHDSRATKMKIDDSFITFTFDNGFWILAENINNSNKKLSCTDKSEVIFHTVYNGAESNVTVYIFTKTDEENKAIREEITPYKLVELVNSGIELEFIYSYKGYQSFLFECWLWFDKEPYHKECEIIISADNVTYNWNSMFVDE